MTATIIQNSQTSLKKPISSDKVDYSHGLSMRLFQNVKQGNGFVKEISKIAKNWTRSIRLIGGYWLGTFEVEDNLTALESHFRDWLGCRVVESYNGTKTWEGMVYEMDLIDESGILRRRSFDEMANYVSGHYQSDEGMVHQLASATHDVSINRYGQKEEYLVISDMPSTAAQNYRDKVLRERALPGMFTVGTVDQTNKLVVTCAGYVHTLNWQFVGAGVLDATTVNLSQYISDIVTSHGAFIDIKKIASNTLQIKKSVSSSIRAWDLLAKLIDVGDTSFKLYQAYVDIDRKFSYHAVPMTPYYYVQGKGGVYAITGGPLALAPWIVKPAVFRDLHMGLALKGCDCGLNDSRDFVVYEVEASAAGGVVLKSQSYEESEIMLAGYAAIKAAENASKSGFGSTGYNMPIWRRHGMTAAEWDKLSRAERLAAIDKRKKKKEAKKS